MRKSVSPKTGPTVARLLGAVLLASTAAGCSSDASRFGSVFSTDTLTTASIGRGQPKTPVPQQDIGGGGYAQQQAQPMGQQMASTGYEPVSARAATMPVTVQRNELAAPAGTTSSNGPISSRGEALAQPMPSASPASAGTVAAAKPIYTPQEPTTTASTPRASNGSAGRVTLRPGESIATLAARHGVSEQEILRANGLTMSSDAAVGQLVIIPASAARAAASANGLPSGGRAPKQPDGQPQNLAVLPNGTGSRDKQGTASTSAGAGSYEVKPGDSLGRIAQAHGVSVDALKRANGLSTGNIRIGQRLAIPAGSKPATQVASAKPVAEPATTASVPAKTAAEPQAVPAATKSVTEVASLKTESAAPEATGIGKYRWPARGAVIANYGANIDGKRSDGIAISVPQGTPIKAAENGVVIYAGNGLKELGNTVLIRHDDGKVTVYGHADSLSVQRGQKVQRGQTIGASGMTGNVSRPMLHFEVRKDAAPVNPITYLE